MARTPRRINFTELSDSLKEFIESRSKIFPIETVDDLPDEKDKDYYRILDGEYKNYIYAWYPSDGEYKPIGADDRDVRWDDVKYKPQEFPVKEHTHDYESLENIPDDFTPKSHEHTESDITDLDKYSQSDVNSLLDGKSNTVHTHTESDISDLDKYTTSEVDSFLDDKVDKEVGKSLSSNDFTDSDKSKLESLSDEASVDYDEMSQQLDEHKSSSDHDGRYYTKSDTDSKLSSKADKSTVNGHIDNSTVHVTQSDKDGWDNKSDFSGDYSDLSGVPSEFTPESHGHSISNVSGLQSELDNKAESKSDIGLGSVDNMSAEDIREGVTSEIVNHINRKEGDTLPSDYPVGVSVFDTGSDVSGYPHTYGTLLNSRGRAGSYGFQLFGKRLGENGLHVRVQDGGSSMTEWAEIYTERRPPSKSDVGLSNVANYRQARSDDGYEIQKNGSDGSGIINFKTE